MSIEGRRGLELLLKTFAEGEEHVNKGDPIQASEKLYKASEEAIKELAYRFALPEYEEAERSGRWTAPLLFRAVRRLAEGVNREILNWWHAAWFLHVEGFHEARLDIEEVNIRVEHIKKLINLARGNKK